MSDLENDSFEMDTSNPERQVASKRPQVYSSYVQSEHTTTNKHRQPKASSNSNRTYIKYPPKKQSDLIKKPKYDNELVSSSEVPALFQNPSILNITEISNETSESTEFLPMIGLNTFECENVFFINNDYALVSIDDFDRSNYNQFCFKGKCSIAVFNGHLGSVLISINLFDTLTP